MKDENTFLGGNYLFIGGVPRSGTTLIHRIMGAHRDIYAGPEFDFIPAGIMSLRRRMIESIRSGRISEVVKEPTLDEAFRDFLHRIFHQKLVEQDKTVFCEKTPASALHFCELSKLFPKAQFIFVVRDPRNIANSMKTVRNKAISQGKRPTRFVRSVTASVEEMNRFFRVINESTKQSDRIHLVYYEDVLNDPVTEIDRLCCRLNIDFSDKMLDIEDKSFVSSLKRDDEWYSRQAVNAGIGKAGVISDTVLSASEIELVEKKIESFDFLRRYNLKTKSVSTKNMLHWYLGKVQQKGLFLPRNKR